MKIIANVLVVAFLSINYVFAQTVSSDFDKVRATYKGLKGISAEVEYIVFQGHSSTKVMDVRTGIFKSNMTDAFTFNLTGTLQCHNPQYDILISKEEKAIVVKKNITAKAQTGFIPGVDTSSGIWKNGIKIYDGNGMRTWRVSFKGVPISEYDMIDITIDTRNYLITSLSLYYRSNMTNYMYSEDPEDNYKPKMVINYKNVRLNPTFTEDEFSEKKYIQVSGNEMKTSKNYVGYELLIQNP